MYMWKWMCASVLHYTAVLIHTAVIKLYGCSHRLPFSSRHHTTDSLPTHVMISTQFYQQAPSSTHRISLHQCSSQPRPLIGDFLMFNSEDSKNSTPGTVVCMCVCVRARRVRVHVCVRVCVHVCVCNSAMPVCIRTVVAILSQWGVVWGPVRLSSSHPPSLPPLPTSGPVGWWLLVSTRISTNTNEGNTTCTLGSISMYWSFWNIAAYCEVYESMYNGDSSAQLRTNTRTP